MGTAPCANTHLAACATRRVASPLPRCSFSVPTDSSRPASLCFLMPTPAAYRPSIRVTNTCPPNGCSHGGTRGSETSSHSPASGTSAGDVDHRNLPRNARASGRPSAAGKSLVSVSRLRMPERTASAKRGATEMTPASGVSTPTTSRIAPSQPGRVRMSDPITASASRGGHSPRYSMRNRSSIGSVRVVSPVIRCLPLADPSSPVPTARGACQHRLAATLPRAASSAHMLRPVAVDVAAGEDHRMGVMDEDTPHGHADDHDHSHDPDHADDHDHSHDDDRLDDHDRSHDHTSEHD